MKISDLPQIIQNRVFELQIASGNKPNAQLDLKTKKAYGNFNWHESKEDYPFWTIINSGHFDGFYHFYPDGVQDPRFDKKKWAKETTRKVISECTFHMSDHNWEELEEVLLKNLDSLPL